MALRGSAARRVPGAPMAGVLRDLQRRSRPTSRRRADAGMVTPPPPAPAAPGRGSAVGVAVVVVTGEDGRAVWRPPRPLPAAPVCAALPVDPDPGNEGGTVIAALEDVLAEQVTVRVWRTRPLRGSGVVAPAGPGVHVHLTVALPAPGDG